MISFERMCELLHIRVEALACVIVADHCQIRKTRVNLLILLVDDEPDVEMLFRQHFRHDIHGGGFTMEFAQSGDMALQRITDAAGASSARWIDS